jgi:hypothetical protein
LVAASGLVVIKSRQTNFPGNSVLVGVGVIAGCFAVEAQESRTEPTKSTAGSGGRNRACVAMDYPDGRRPEGMYWRM